MDAGLNLALFLLRLGIPRDHMSRNNRLHSIRGFVFGHDGAARVTIGVHVHANALVAPCHIDDFDRDWDGNSGLDLSGDIVHFRLPVEDISTME
jgi:hypothetical protein